MREDQGRAMPHGPDMDRSYQEATEEGFQRNGHGTSPEDGHNRSLTPTAEEVILRMREAVLSGVPWHVALLEAVGRWTLPEETVDDRHYCYLLLGEAFDWLVLAERLCSALEELVPLEEREQLFFYGRLPVQMTVSQFKGLVGASKYRAFLNFWYGVVVEEALLLAVEEEVRKQRRANGRPDSEELVEEAYQRIYGETRDRLLKQFRAETGYPSRSSMSLTEHKEFTYWLFKRRVKNSEPARVASDTRKGLLRLQRLRGTSRPASLQP